MKANRVDEIKIQELAEKYKIDPEIVRKIVQAPYDFIQKKTKEITFEDGLNREEFDSMKKNFNLPGIGKLYASFFSYEEICKKRRKKLGS